MNWAGIIHNLIIDVRNEIANGDIAPDQIDMSVPICTVFEGPLCIGGHVQRKINKLFHELPECRFIVVQYHNQLQARLFYYFQRWNPSPEETIVAINRYLAGDMNPWQIERLKK